MRTIDPGLAAHLAGGDGLLLPDFDDPSPEIRLSIRIDAPRARVFRALLDPELLNRWIASAAEVDPRAGGAYRFGWKYEVAGREVVGGPTRILELVENEKLVTDWPDWRGDADVPVQTITWRLEDDGDGTRVTLVHSGFTRAADWSDYPFGWGYFLGALKGAAETPAA
ncbi:MAG: SRPBCC domain-containing protein [Acidobacteria bacterium]|nr:SRPBCC domain-containing protein [Acidobacteriota bacterium]